MEPNAENSCRRDAIKEKLRQNFDGKIVRKDLTKKKQEAPTANPEEVEKLLESIKEKQEEEVKELQKR